MLTQERLQEVLSYDPETGVFVWKISKKHSTKKIGDTATTNHGNGYLTIWVDKARYYAHRLAWLYMEGYLPEHQIDHINGIRGDNKWCNLRHVTQSCNMQNSSIKGNNTSGYRGVTWNGQAGKWLSKIVLKDKQIHLGFYSDPLDAALARITAEDWEPDFHCDERCVNRKKVFTDLKAGPAV